MPDLRQQVQKHYEEQGLSAAKVEAILAESRVPVEGGEKMVSLEKRRNTAWRIAWAIAAGFVVMAGLATWWSERGGRVSYAELAPRVVEFFRHDPELPKKSQNPEELRAWLLAQGAPADFQIPPKLSVLKSFGCQVVDVHGQPAYLTCFWSGKEQGSSLVHLLVARRRDFKNVPPSEAPQFQTIGQWSFAAWSSGDVIYTMATAAPLERLKTFVGVAVRHARSSERIAGMTRFGPPWPL